MARFLLSTHLQGAFIFLMAILLSGCGKPTGLAEQETLTVSFQDGGAGTSTAYEYSGMVTIVAEGQGQAAGAKWSDPFYIYTDEDGQKIAPWHPTEYYNWSLWINGEQVDSFIESIPPYNSNHIYEFTINAPGGYLAFAVGDTATSDNNGYFTITIFK